MWTRYGDDRSLVNLKGYLLTGRAESDAFNQPFDDLSILSQIIDRIKQRALSNPKLNFIVRFILNMIAVHLLIRSILVYC